MMAYPEKRTPVSLVLVLLCASVSMGEEGTWYLEDQRMVTFVDGSCSNAPSVSFLDISPEDRERERTMFFTPSAGWGRWAEERGPEGASILPLAWLYSWWFSRHLGIVRRPRGVADPIVLVPDHPCNGSVERARVIIDSLREVSNLCPAILEGHQVESRGSHEIEFIPCERRRYPSCMAH
jgi:hypothetical protein